MTFPAPGGSFVLRRLHRFECFPVTSRVLLVFAVPALVLGCRTAAVPAGLSPFGDPALEKEWKETETLGGKGAERCEEALKELGEARSKKSRARAWEAMTRGYDVLVCAVRLADGFVVKNQSRLPVTAITACERRLAEWSAVLSRVRKSLPLEYMEKVEAVPEMDLADPRNRIE